MNIIDTARAHSIRYHALIRHIEDLHLQLAEEARADWRAR